MKKSDISHDSFKTWLDKVSSMPENLNEATEQAIIRFAEAHAIAPPSSLKQMILQKVKMLHAAESNQQPLDINALPLLSADSNWIDWQTCVQHISPPDSFDDVFLHTLEVSPQRKLFIVWVKEYIDEEVHYDLVESFLILEGSCECRVLDANGDTRVVRMSAGDFLEIPVGKPHNIIITSLQPVKAILQCESIRA